MSLAIALGGGLSCRKHPTQPPELPPEARADDAADLPAFETGIDPDAEPDRYYVPLGDAPVRGPETAAVTIVMFSDFECPFCKQGNDVLKHLAAKYRDQVRIAYKPFPLDSHSNALPAAMAARTAHAQGKFWGFHDLLFSQRGIDVPQLVEYAQKVGLDLEVLKRDLESLEYGPEVRRDMRLARRLGVTSTPTFFINGRALSGAQPVEVFEGIVEEELELAAQWKKSGVADTELYQHAIKDGYTRVEFSRRRGLDPDKVFPVPIGNSPALGPATSPVTIVMFGDFQCPFCTRGLETVESVRTHYGNKIRIVYKHNPLSFHSHAFVAARASLAAAQQDKFWEFHDALYKKQANFDEDDLVAIAKSLGLNMKKFFKAMNSTDLDERIEADLGLAMALGVTGTPAYFVNGRPIEGAVPEIHFRLMIEEELDRAAAARKKGVAAEDLYETLSHQQLED